MSTTFPSPLTKQEEAYYVAKLEEGSLGIADGKVIDEQLAQQALEARNILIEHNLRLVAHIAKKYVSTGTSQDDLISIGTIGLIKAVNTYSGGRSTRLATYAARCIENATLSQMRLWFRTNPPRAEKNQNGVFWHRLQRIYTSFAPLRMVM